MVARVGQTVYTGKRPGRERGRSTTNAGTVQRTISTQGVTEVNEVQIVTTDGTGGTFTLTYDDQETGNIAFDAAAATVETAVELLSNITAVTVTGSAGGPWTIEFADAGFGDALMLVADDALLTGATLGTVITEDTVGVANVYEVVEAWTDADGGTFKFSFGGQLSSAIAFDAAAATVETAVEATTGITAVGVSGTGTEADPWIITFGDAGSVADLQFVDVDLTKAWAAPTRTQA